MFILSYFILVRTRLATELVISKDYNIKLSFNI